MWTELSEVILFLLPLVDVAAVKRVLRSALPRLPALVGAGGTGAGGGRDGGGDAHGAPCGVCGAQDILTPYAAQPCGDRFCYFCLRSRVLADPRYQCPVCLARVEAMRPSPLELFEAGGGGGGGGGGGIGEGEVAEAAAAPS